jgi:GNAT superfamily N-acetyltransferase
VDLTITLHDGTTALDLTVAVIIPLYEATHADLLDNPFYATPRFVERLRAYAARDGFGLAMARSASGHPLGQAFGYPLPPGSRWWEGLVTPVPDRFTKETGTRTFALNELMVHPDHQRLGIARALHDRLLASRHEQRATLLVRADNDPARTAYARWGWHAVAQLQPFPDSPLYDALILELPRGTMTEPTTSRATTGG